MRKPALLILLKHSEPLRSQMAAHMTCAEVARSAAQLSLVLQRGFSGGVGEPVGAKDRFCWIFGRGGDRIHVRSLG